MKRDRPPGLGDYSPLIFPAAMITVFFVITFVIMIVVCFFRRLKVSCY